MRCRNVEQVMAFIEQVFDDNVRKLETEIVLSFEQRGDYPDPDDMDAMLAEQRAQKQVWLDAMREKITTMRFEREPSCGTLLAARDR